MMKPLVLASQSPRRKSLLESAGITVLTAPADTAEEVRAEDSAENNTLRIAREKATAIAPRFSGSVVLAADTTVVLPAAANTLPLGQPVSDGVLLGKPKDREHLKAMLEGLSGRTHIVYTAFVLIGSSGQIAHEEVVSTEVSLLPLTERDLSLLLDSGDGIDKAGGYGIQGPTGFFIDRISGSYTCVQGLPLPQVLQALRTIGVW